MFSEGTSGVFLGTIPGRFSKGVLQEEIFRRWSEEIAERFAKAGTPRGFLE